MKRILLHTCCGPCATHCVDVLRREWDVSLFFANSNIAPRDEYETRLAAARQLAERLGLPLFVDPYDHAAWLEEIRGMENEPEKGARCARCFAFNLRRTARHAGQNGFDAFTTTLTVSPHKDSASLFRVGEEWESFLAVNFKKADGFRHSLRLAAEYDLYRQDYCGCEFSLHPPRRLGETPRPTDKGARAGRASPG